MMNDKGHRERIVEEITTHLSSILTDNETKFPIKYTDTYGKWEIHENGDSFVVPHKAAEYIEVTFTITPDGVEFNEDGK